MLRLVCLLLALGHAASCTTIVAGRLATADGSVLSTHSNDGEGATDPRLVRVPPADYKPGALRPVFFSPENYPRYVGAARGVSAYLPVGNQSAFEPIGYIPQVAHTFGYFEETYGALNEKQVGIAESTCSGVFGTKPRGQGGKALLSVDALTQIAMERAHSSREAVQLMGSLAEAHGFYGAGSFEGTAESLLVSDPREGWVFHILPDPSGTGAIWAAQRVPDEHIAVVPNVFIIRQVNFSEPSTFLGSASVHSVALAKGWWRPEDGLLDFTAIYSDGEYNFKYYSGRRSWGAFQLLAPSLALDPSYGEWRKDSPYPFSAPPDDKVTVATLARAMRSYYEGTPFDQTKGLAGGPWGTPDHVVGASAGGRLKGHWERTIGLYRTSDSYIVQSRSWLPDQVGGVLWWGAHAAPYTSYVPLAAGMVSLPRCFEGHPAALDKGTLFWAVRFLANYVQLKHSLMVVAVQTLQQELHGEALELQAAMDALGAAAGPAELTQAYSRFAGAALRRIWQTADSLMFRYADGLVSEVSARDGTFSATAPPYPDWWLRAVGFGDEHDAHGPRPLGGGEGALDGHGVRPDERAAREVA